MLHLYKYENDTLVSTAVDVDHVAAASSSGVCWFDLCSPTLEEERFLENLMGADMPSLEEVKEIEPSSRLHDENGVVFMTITALAGAVSASPVQSPVTFILKGNTLVTLRYADIESFAVFSNNLPRTWNAARATAEFLMLGLIDAVVARLADLLESAGREIDTISQEIFRSNQGHSKSDSKTRNLQSLIERIGVCGDMMSLVRESIVSITRLLTHHQTRKAGDGGRQLINRSGLADVNQKAQALRRDVLSLGDHCAFLSNKVSFLLNATLGLINLEQNQIIKIFSVAAVVFLPPTLVASIYGMNFHNMPELNWDFGYLWAIFLMIIAVFLPYFYFRRRGWL